MSNPGIAPIVIAGGEVLAHKDQPNGYPGLDAGGYLKLNEFQGVALVDSPNTFSRWTHLAPTDVTTNSLLITIPDLDNIGGTAGLKLIDGPASNGRCIQVEHNAAAANAGAPENYGIEIHNYPGANSPFVIHQYSDATYALQLDNTGSHTAIILRNTENPGLNPGDHGTGHYIDIVGYTNNRSLQTANMTSGSNTLTVSVGSPFGQGDIGKQVSVTGAGVAGATLVTKITAVPSSNTLTLQTAASTTVTNAQVLWSSTFTNGAMTSGSAILTDTTNAPFTAADPGKSISVVGAGVAGATLTTTILSYQSASQVTLAVAASTTVAGASYVYITKGDLTTIAQLQSALTWATLGPQGFTFTSTLAESSALTVLQPASGPSSSHALDVTQNSNAVALFLTNNGNFQGLWIAQNGTGQAAVINQNAGPAIALSVNQTSAAFGVNINQGAGGAGFYGLNIAAQDFGASISTSVSAGVAFVVSKNGTGAGTGMRIVNKGTGATLDVEVGSTPATVWQLDQNGNIFIPATAPVGLKIATGANQKMAFWNATPVIQQAISYSRSTAGETAAVAAIRGVLATIGLLADNTTA